MSKKSRPEAVVYLFATALAIFGIAFFNVVSDWLAQYSNQEVIGYSLLAVVILGFIGRYKLKTVSKRIRKKVFG